MSILAFFDLRKFKKVEIAKAANISNSVLSKYLHGWESLPRKHVSSLAKALGVTCEEIVANRISDSRVRALSAG